jgi:hypothetical protein
MRKGVHIGSIIRRVVLERNIDIVTLADRLCYHRTNIYSLFERASIDTAKLVLISEVLSYNFLLEYFDEDEMQEDYIVIARMSPLKA